MEAFGDNAELKNNKWFIKCENDITLTVKEIIETIDNVETKYHIVKYYKKGIQLLEWKDVNINDNSFNRIIGRTTYTFKRRNNKSIYKLISKMYIRKIKFMPYKDKDVINITHTDSIL